MYNIFKLTLVLFVAAAIMSVTSCSKDDDASVSDADLVGEWGFTDNRQNPNITINADHTCKIGNQPYNWTLSDNTFKATQEGTTNVCEFTITEFSGNTMKITGSKVYFGNTSDYSGSLRRTTTVIPTVLNESEMLGSWELNDPNRHWVRCSITLNADHTGLLDTWPATWSVSGTTFSMTDGDGIAYMYATVKSVTVSSTKVVMEVEGGKGWHRSEGDDEEAFAGTFTKNL